MLFACPCGECSVRPLDELLLMLDKVRGRAGIPFQVNSGPTCVEYRISKDYSPTSEHIICTGADIACDSSIDRWKIVTAAIAEGVVRIGIGENFVHLGVSQEHTQETMWDYY